MIIWSGFINGNWYYRCLGPDGTMSTALHEAPLYEEALESCTMIRHNESTTRTNGTSPTIGHGVSKTSRDYCIHGYGVGSSLGDLSQEPPLFNYATDHALAYDLEIEFVSRGECNTQSPILCSSLVCTCGWSLLITRSRVHDERVNQLVLDSSEAIAIATIEAILVHAPAFSMGHNIYAFDNAVLAFALPPNHPYVRFFRSITKSSNNTAPTVGLILDIPGVNNLDTLIYVRSSMFGTFSQFSLDYLAKQLKLPMLKGCTNKMKFEIEWFEGALNNSRLMSVYNIMDCCVVLELCKNLDLINQIIALCYCSRAWIEDVMLYNTGAMATSCICFNAMEHKCVYNWTRCDWKPQDFKGGEILYSQPLIAHNVLVVDFTSMYPSIICSAGISPESIDFECSMYHRRCRFDSIEVHISLMKHSAGSFLGACVIGTDAPYKDGQDPRMECIIGEWYNVVSTAPDEEYVSHMLRSTVMLQDPSLRVCSIQVVLHDYDTAHSNILGEDRSNEICKCCMVRHAESLSANKLFVPLSWCWPKSSLSHTDYAVDWLQVPSGHATIVSGPDFQARFFPGRRICAEACRSLISTRKRFKQKLKEQQREGNGATNQAKVYDQIQYAYKINANSLYGIMSFPQYNTYSPRCGMSITACGRWALNVTAAIIGNLGFDVLYGDTDSVMFTLGGNSNSMNAFMRNDRYRPIQDYVDVLMRDSEHISVPHLCEYLAASPGSERLYSSHMTTVRGLVPKIVNRIMSYTCLTDLKVERQDTGVKIGDGISSSVYKSFVLLTKKHYSAALRDDTHITKGISFVRRSGAIITDIAYRRFINIMQQNSTPSSIVKDIRREYRSLYVQVTKGSGLNHAYMVIRTTVMGITDDYISVLVSSDKQPIKVLKSEYNDSTMVYNTKYYLGLLDRCLASILDALKVADSGFIKTAGTS